MNDLRIDGSDIKLRGEIVGYIRTSAHPDNIQEFKEILGCVRFSLAEASAHSRGYEHGLAQGYEEGYSDACEEVIRIYELGIEDGKNHIRRKLKAM